MAVIVLHHDSHNCAQSWWQSQYSINQCRCLWPLTLQLAIIVILTFAIMLAIFNHDCWHRHNHDITQNLAEQVFHCDGGHDNSDGHHCCGEHFEASGRPHHEKEKMTNVPSFLKLFMPATSYLLLENGSINLIFMQTSTFPDHLIRCQQWFVKIVLIWSNSKDIFKTSSLSYYSHIPPLYGLLLTSPTLNCLPHFLILTTFWMKSQYGHQADIH